ncbi:MAG: hypothetical protein L0229_11055 [Blastocatellia bacterium]|nr:hypothetical protein [Blastocatellia bacterium]
MRRLYIAILLVIVWAAVLTGCKEASKPPEGGTASSSGANGNGSPSAAQAPSRPGGNTPTASAPARPPAFLSGVYVISEVHKNGVVTMIKPENSTEINFKPDGVQSNLSGTFDRKSRRGGKVDYSDSGQYVVKGSDELVLNILISRKKVVTKPVQKRYKYRLSGDGDEIRLETEEGNTAVFRRIAKPAQ